MNIEKCYKVRKHTKVTEVNFDVIRNDLLAFNYDSSTVLKTILVIEEIITNILKYSANQGDINTVISFSEDEILINIEDYGKYFDPTSEKDVNITEELSKRDTGGLGIHIVKNISTNISYHRVGGHNILQITINAEKNPIKATGLMKNQMLKVKHTE